MCHANICSLFLQIHNAEIYDQSTKENQETTYGQNVQDCGEQVTITSTNEASTSNANSSAEAISEEDIDNFLENEEGNKVQIDKKHIPDIGMEFRSDKEAHGFFNFYVYLVGFSIVITHHYKTTSKKRNGEITRYTYQCYRYGKNDDGEKNKHKTGEEQRNTNVIDRTNCKCLMVVKEVGKYEGLT